jgi:heme-degrading monooxygenase HmoA
MVLELVEIEVKPGSEAAFEAAYGQATELLKRAKGCRSVRVMRAIEKPCRYRVFVQWQTLENHTGDFRGSPDHRRLIELTRPHYAQPAEVVHYAVAIAGFGTD